MHKLIVFLAGTIFGFTYKPVIDKIKSPTLENVIKVQRCHPHTLEANETADETEPVGTCSMLRTP